jgi:hypothetical protein
MKKTFLIEDFTFATGVRGAPLLRTSLRIFQKIGNGTNSILRGLGETDK